MLRPDAIAIFGNPPIAADVALRRFLKFKEHCGSVIILDYTGRGSILLGNDNKMSLLRRPVTWYDLADRQRPVALFQLRRSEHFRTVMLRVLRMIREVSRMHVKDTTLDWATEAAYNLSRDGIVGLGSLLRSLSSPEVRRWFLDTQNDPDDLGLFLEMISWALRYPSVYAISEAINRPNLQEDIRKSGTVWIESHIEHFEMHEHFLIVGLAEAAVEDALRTILNGTGKRHNQSEITTVVHLFPSTAISSELPGWVRETSNTVRHVSVHQLQPDRPIRPLSMAWSHAASNVWIVGKLQPLHKSAHENWLSEKEIERINILEPGDLWMKSNSSGKWLVLKTGCIEESISLAHKLRHDAAKRRKVTPVRQMAAAVP